MTGRAGTASGRLGPGNKNYKGGSVREGGWKIHPARRLVDFQVGSCFVSFFNHRFKRFFLRFWEGFGGQNASQNRLLERFLGRFLGTLILERFCDDFYVIF